MRSKTRLLLPLVQKRVDIPELLRRLYGEPEFRGTLTFCPFHDNTETPAFSVFADGARFKCHSCGVRGDVIDFWQLAYKQKTGRALTFKAAVASLAQLAGFAEAGDVAKDPKVLTVIAQALRTDPKGKKNEVKRQLVKKAHDLLNPLILSVRNTDDGVNLALWAAEQIDELIERVEELPYQRFWEEVLGWEKCLRSHLRHADRLVGGA